MAAGDPEEHGLGVCAAEGAEFVKEEKPEDAPAERLALSSSSYGLGIAGYRLASISS